jgi:hypothetical protein
VTDKKKRGESEPKKKSTSGSSGRNIGSHSILNDPDLSLEFKITLLYYMWKTMLAKEDPITPQESEVFDLTAEKFGVPSSDLLTLKVKFSVPFSDYKPVGLENDFQILMVVCYSYLGMTIENKIHEGSKNIFDQICSGTEIPVSELKKIIDSISRNKKRIEHYSDWDVVTWHVIREILTPY